MWVGELGGAVPAHPIPYPKSPTRDQSWPDQVLLASAPIQRGHGQPLLAGRRGRRMETWRVPRTQPGHSASSRASQKTSQDGAGSVPASSRSTQQPAWDPKKTERWIDQPAGWLGGNGKVVSEYRVSQVSHLETFQPGLCQVPSLQTNVWEPLGLRFFPF